MLQRWFSAGIATRRLVVVFCVAVSLVALAVRYPDAFHDANDTARANAALDLVDRDVGAGNSVFPDQGLLVEARGLIPPGETSPSPSAILSLAGPSSRPARPSSSCAPISSRGDWIRTGRGSCALRATGTLSGRRRCLGRGQRALDPAARIVTVHAILGLAALNGAYAVLGVTLLWAIRGLRHWSDVLHLAGLGYLLTVTDVRDRLEHSC